MTRSFERIVVPVASETDAAATVDALEPHLGDPFLSATFLTVVEKAGGGIDKASVEYRERDAREAFDAVEDRIADVESFEFDTEVAFGVDVAETVLEVAHDRSASAVVFTPRGGSRWMRLLTGDVSTSLIRESDLPVIVLPDEE